MPRLWEASIDAHRQAVRSAAIDAAGQLVAEGGIRRVTMSAVAEAAGVGRATLYKYFPDVESLLLAWHQKQVQAHLTEVEALVEGHDSAQDGLRAMLDAIAMIEFGRPDGEFVVRLHREHHVDRAGEHLNALLRDLLAQCAGEGHVRGDVAPDELAVYCLHALQGAQRLRSKAAARRLVGVVLAGLAHPSGGSPLTYP